MGARSNSAAATRRFDAALKGTQLANCSGSSTALTRHRSVLLTALDEVQQRMAKAVRLFDLRQMAGVGNDDHLGFG